MKFNKLWLVVVMFAVLAVPAMATTDESQSVWLNFTNSPFEDVLNGFDLNSSNVTQSTSYPSYNTAGNGAPYSGNYGSAAGTVDIDTTSMNRGDAADPFTYCGWYNINSGVSTYSYAFTRIKDDSDANYRLIFGKIGANWAMQIDDNLAGPTQISTTLPSTGTWFHSCMGYDGSTMRLYMNGALASSVSVSKTMSPFNGRVCTSGYCSLGTHKWNGLQDDVQIFNETLSATNISYLYNYGYFNYAPPTPPDTRFNITAYDAETAQQILTFNTTLNGTVLSTTNGTIIYNVTGFYNTVVNASGYQTVTTSKTYVAGTTTQWNLTAINRTVTFKAFDNTSTPINTFNMTTGTGGTYTTTNGTIFASLDRTVLHNLTFAATNYYDNVTLNYNVTSDLNVTLLSPFRDVTFTATNYSGSPISNFNVTVDGTTYSVVASQVVNLDTRELYNVTFDKHNYFDDVQLNVNVSSDVVGNLTEYFNILVGTQTTTSGGTGTFVNGVNYSDVAYSALIDFTNSSTAVSDPSGSGFELSLTGASIDTTSGYMLCDGTNDYAESNLAVNLTAPYTLTLKINQHVKEADHPIISKYVSGSDRWYLFSSNTNWQARVVGTNGGGDSFNIKVPGTSPYLTANADYTYVVVNDGVRTVVYINGTKLLNNSNTADVSNTKPLRFCNNDVIHTTNYFDGNLSQFYIFDTALTEQEVINHTQNVQYNNTFNPFTNTSGGTVVTNSTDQYYVNWNSTNYYPQTADNKTYLPVRFTLENFTVNPTTVEFKQAVFTNYNTTSHLAFTFNNSHEVTATNRYDSTAISNFTVNVSGTLYTANGTKAYLQNETGIVNYSVTHPSYLTAYNTNVDVTNGSSTVLMHQVEVRFNGTQRFTNNSVTEGNVTIGVTKRAFGEPFYLNAGTYTATYTSVHDEAVPQNFTFAALENVTRTITNITNANLTITGTDAITGANIPFFTTTVVNNTLFINTSTTDNSPHLYNLLQNVTYNVEFDNSSYALNDTNITLTNRSTSLEFTVYTTNSFNISILDEQNQSRITNTNFTVEFIGSYASYNTSYTDGNLYVDLIVPDTYQIRYQYINDTGAVDYGMLRQYYYTLTNRTYNPIDVYALQDSESSEITVTVQNADTLQREEGIIVLLQRYYIDENAYETVAMYQTDSQGRAYFDVELDNELYRFVMQSPLGTTLRTTEPAYLHESSYIIYTVTTVENIETGIDLGEIDATFDWNNATQQLTVTYTDPASVYSQYQLNLYEKGTYTNTLINTSTSTTSTGTLVVSYTFQNDTEYIGTLSVSNSPAIEIARFSLTDFIETQPLPNLSLFLVSILFTIMVFVSSFSLYSVVIGAVALVAAQVMGLLAFSTPVVGMILFGAIFLAVILEWRRG